MKLRVGMLLLGLFVSQFAHSQSVTPIQHVIIVFQENRSPDNLFHGLAGADIANAGMNSAGQTIVLRKISLVTNYDPQHSHGAFLAMYNGGKMNGANKIHITCKLVNSTSVCPPAAQCELRVSGPRTG